MVFCISPFDPGGCWSESISRKNGEASSRVNEIKQAIEWVAQLLENVRINEEQKDQYGNVVASPTSAVSYQGMSSFRSV